MTCATPSAESSAAQLFYAEEVECWNQDPNGANPAIDWPNPPTTGSTKLIELPFTGENFSLNKATRRSAEIRSDGQVARRILQSRETNGGFGFEWQWAAYDPFLTAAIRATGFGTPVSNTATVTVTGSSNTFAGTGIATGLSPGMWIRVRGCANAANNGFFKVATVADANTFTTVQTTPVNETDTAGVQVYTSIAANGSAKRSFLFEVMFSDITDGKFKYFPGSRVNFELAMTTDDITGRVDTVGAPPVTGDNSVGDGTPTVKTSRTPFNTENNIGLCMYNNEMVDLLTGWSISTNNELAAQRVIKKGLGDVRRGQIDITGTFNPLHYAKDFYRAHLEHEAFSLVQSFHDGTNHLTANSYIFEIPRAVFLSGDPNAEQNNEAVDTPLTWGAEVDPTTGLSIRVYRFPGTI